MSILIHSSAPTAPVSVIAAVRYLRALQLAARATHERILAAINVHKPYKPRRLLTDTYHTLLRRARKTKPRNSLKEARQKRTREKWEQRNKMSLRRRAQIVREKRKALGLDK